MKKIKDLYSGKTKTLYATDDPQFLIAQFRDDITAYNAEKKSQLQNKGKVNNHFNAFIMEKLHAAGIPTHFEKILNEQESLIKHLDMIPVECVIRNIATGSLCKRLGVPDGIGLEPPIFEFFFKNDELNDPMINDYHIRTFGWATDDEIKIMKELSFKTNEILKPLFLEADLLLVDYKLEFGRFNHEIFLGDEFTPDGCRIWDVNTRKKLDKDRFRKDLGDVIEAYQEVANRLGVEV